MEVMILVWLREVLEVFSVIVMKIAARASEMSEFQTQFPSQPQQISVTVEKKPQRFKWRDGESSAWKYGVLIYSARFESWDVHVSGEDSRGYFHDWQDPTVALREVVGGGEGVEFIWIDDDFGWSKLMGLAGVR